MDGHKSHKGSEKQKDKDKKNVHMLDKSSLSKCVPLQEKGIPDLMLLVRPLLLAVLYTGLAFPPASHPSSQWQDDRFY